MNQEWVLRQRKALYEYKEHRRNIVYTAHHQLLTSLHNSLEIREYYYVFYSFLDSNLRLIILDRLDSNLRLYRIHIQS